MTSGMPQMYQTSKHKLINRYYILIRRAAEDHLSSGRARMLAGPMHLFVSRHVVLGLRVWLAVSASEKSYTINP